MELLFGTGTCTIGIVAYAVTISTCANRIEPIVYAGSLVPLVLVEKKEENSRKKENNPLDLHLMPWRNHQQLHASDVQNPRRCLSQGF